MMVVIIMPPIIIVSIITATIPITPIMIIGRMITPRPRGIVVVIIGVNIPIKTIIINSPIIIAYCIPIPGTAQ